MGMKYTKEQAQVLALLVIMGCAVVVLSFLYLVKPNFEVAAESNNEMKRTETAIGKLSHAPVALAKAKNEIESLAATIERGEKAVFAGMELAFALSQICGQAGTALNLKPASGEPTTTELLEFSQRGSDGTQETKHYDEVSRTLDIGSVDFFSLCRFLGAIEEANQGLRVTGLQIESGSLDPQLQGEGKVSTSLELSLAGMREGEPPETSTMVVNISSDPFDVGERRNPFGLPGGLWDPEDDPLLRGKEALRRMKVKGIMAEWLLVEVPARTRSGQATSRILRLREGQTAVIGGTKMKYVQEAGDSFVFEATGHGVRFIVETNYKGEVTTIKEEEVK